MHDLFKPTAQATSGQDHQHLFQNKLTSFIQSHFAVICQPHKKVPVPEGTIWSRRSVIDDIFPGPSPTKQRLMLTFLQKQHHPQTANKASSFRPSRRLPTLTSITCGCMNVRDSIVPKTPPTRQRHSAWTRRETEHPCRRAFLLGRRYPPGDERNIVYVLPMTALHLAVSQWCQYLCSKIGDRLVKK
jgi:hypothetical protein